jgi:hypothetical protein
VGGRVQRQGVLAGPGVGGPGKALAGALAVQTEGLAVVVHPNLQARQTGLIPDILGAVAEAVKVDLLQAHVEAGLGADTGLAADDLAPDLMDADLAAAAQYGVANLLDLGGGSLAETGQGEGRAQTSGKGATQA